MGKRTTLEMRRAWRPKQPIHGVCKHSGTEVEPCNDEPVAGSWIDPRVREAPLKKWRRMAFLRLGPKRRLFGLAAATSSIPTTNGIAVSGEAFGAAPPARSCASLAAARMLTAISAAGLVTAGASGRPRGNAATATLMRAQAEAHATLLWRCDISGATSARRINSAQKFDEIALAGETRL